MADHRRKRKQTDTNDDDDDDDSDVNFVDVQFDFFDPNPTADYHSLNRLLNQLFQSDAELFHTHQLTELVLSQPNVGTTIKTDDIDSDPYAFLTVLNMHVHQDHPSIKALREYVLHNSSPNTRFHTDLQFILDPAASGHVGLVICERLVNMPVEVIPPMYRMLSDELKMAVQDNQPFTFTHLLFISRTYRLSTEDEAAIQAQSAAVPRSKRARKLATSKVVAPPADGIYSFHPEDEYILQLSSHAMTYSIVRKNEPRGESALGLETGGRMMLVPFDRFEELVKRMSDGFVVA